MAVIGGIFLFLVLALGLGALIGMVFVEIRRTQLRRGKHGAIQRKIEQINRDFPDEVRAWGGPEVLKDPRTVRSILLRLEAEAGR